MPKYGYYLAWCPTVSPHAFTKHSRIARRIHPAQDRTNGKSIGRDYYGIGFPSLGENDYPLVYVENLEATGKLSQRVGPMFVPANNQAGCMSLE